MAGSSHITISETIEVAVRAPSCQIAPSKSKSNIIVVDKTLSGAANLVKLLPSGTVLAFQSVSPSFSNHGNCNNSPNKYFTGFLISLCTFICFLFSFTDSFVGSNGKLYYGIATFKDFYIFNNEERDNMGEDLKVAKRFRMRIVDVVHAIFSCLVFISLAFSDSDVQKCLIPSSYYENMRDLLNNLPLGVGLLSGLVFMVFPTCRKGIGYSEMAH